MDVVVWLRSLGLGKYEAAFRDNEIDETVLPSLTHETLKELGVTAVGHRLKLLDAISALGSDTIGKTLSVDAATSSSLSSPRPEDRAERRQVTVMFSDLVGSTALSARMAPRICEKSFRPTKSALRRPCSVSAGSWRNTWATECCCTLATPKHTRTMPSGRCAPDWNWSVRSAL